MTEEINEPKHVEGLIDNIIQSSQEYQLETLCAQIEELGRRGEVLPLESIKTLVELIYKDPSGEVVESAWRALGSIVHKYEGPKLKISKRMMNIPQKAENGEQFEIALAFLENQLWDVGDNRPFVLEQVLDALGKEEELHHWQVRQAAADWLGDKAADIVSNDRLTGLTLEELIRRVSLREEDDDYVRRSAWKSTQRIWNAGWQMSSPVLDITQVQLIVLNKVLKLLDKSDDVQIRISTVDWLSDNAVAIAKSNYSSYKKVTLALYAVAEEESIADDLRDSAETTLRNIWKALHDHQLPIQEENLIQGENENDKALAIMQLADQNTLGSRESVRLLVDTWVCWIYNEQEPRLVELTSEAIRYNRYAVLALIEHFGRRVSGSIESNGSNAESGLEQQIFEGSPDPASGDYIPEENEEDKTGRRFGEAVSQPLYKISEGEKQLLVEMRIAKQLADMSDPTYYEDAQSLQYERWRNDEYKYIKQELKKHAVPVFLRRLPEEQESAKVVDNGDEEAARRIGRIRKNIHENIIRMLGNTGGREAVDALSRQVVGRERMRKARQDLLDRYYLKPSQERSDQAATILEGSIAESKRTLRILQILNTAVFFVGLILLIVGIYYSMQGQSQASRVAGALSALGGFTGMIVLLIRDPLERIQNAMANLVQVETAFTSFIWELNLNGTYIQSLYVKNGRLENKEIMDTANRIENAMELTMNLVSIYTKEELPHLVTRINRLVPAAGGVGGILKIYGQHLLGDSSQKKKRAGQIAIDHKPVGAEAKSWEDNLVEFTLTADDFIPLLSPDGDKRTFMISLIIDGMETNAIPFHLLELPIHNTHGSSPDSGEIEEKPIAVTDSD